MKKPKSNHQSKSQAKRNQNATQHRDKRDAAARKVDPLANLFASDERLQAVAMSVRSADEKAALAYLSVADRHGTRAMESEMARCIREAIASNSAMGLALLHRSTSISANTGTALFDNRQVRKELTRFKKDNPASIARAVVHPVMVGNECHYKVATVALALVPEAGETPRLATPAAAASTGLPTDVFVQSPSAEDADRLVAAFWSAPAAIRRLTSSIAKDVNPEGWRQKRSGAIVGVSLLDLVTPAKKMLVASGLGKEILSHAMTGPDARIKRASKVGLTREELTHLIWCHALANNRPAPPLMKL